jgi:hypothetical protein
MKIYIYNYSGKIKMIIVKLSGGLGNQMFQYAAAKALSTKDSIELKLDISHFDKIISNQTIRHYRLNVFPNIQEKIADKKEINNLVPHFTFDFFNKVYRNINKKVFNFNTSYKTESNLFHSEITLNIRKKAYLDGYWQSEKYFTEVSDLIRECFSLDYLSNHPPLQSVIQLIQSQLAVSIHVRRGDYITNPSTNSYHGILEMDYYERAITTIVASNSTDIVFYIFSDDIEWCKKNLKIPFKHVYISTGEDYHDLYLMSSCRHNIIANSSFSWWAAWLNRHNDKIIIAPKKWFSDQPAKDIVPVNWITQ